MTNWQVGDTVRLKSGGPRMTVKKHWESDRNVVECHWFEENELRQGKFAPDELTEDDGTISIP